MLLNLLFPAMYCNITMKNVTSLLLRVISFFQLRYQDKQETTTYEFFAACDIYLLSTLPRREMPTFFLQIFFYSLLTICI